MVWQALDRRRSQIVSEEAVLTDSLRDKIEALRSRFPTAQAVLLPALLAVQRELGYVPARVGVELSELLGISPATVFDTLSFYAQLWKEPKGRHIIVVCRGLSCQLCGGEELLVALKTRLGIDEHATTPDGRFTLLVEECLGACDKAPCVIIDEEAIGPIHPEGLDEVLGQYA